MSYYPRCLSSVPRLQLDIRGEAFIKLINSVADVANNDEAFTVRLRLHLSKI